MNYFINYLQTAVVGDIIGYRDGIWEFNGRSNESYRQVGYQYTNEIVFQFIALGGIVDIDIRNWNISDDTIMLYDTAEVLCRDFASLDNFGDNLAREFAAHLQDIKKGHGGNRTIQSLTAIQSGVDWKKLPYDPTAKGSGTAMRTSVIGVLFCGEENRDKLFDLTITACRITHFSVVGILSGLQVALFSAYAVEGVPCYLWIDDMMRDIDIHYKKLEKIFKGKEWEIEFQEFSGKMKKYSKWRFTHIDSASGINHLSSKLTTNPAVRIKYLADHFTDSTTDNFFPGGRGDEAALLAYDALIESQGIWEKLVVYGCLHSGDSDTVGSIAAGLFALVYPNNVKKYDHPHVARLEETDVKKSMKKAMMNLKKFRN